ncbi:MAG: DUF615 domain-containing protein [Desulfobulbus sp.]
MQISRSEQKRRVREVGRLARELVLLPEAVREQSPELEAIRSLLREAVRLSRGAQQRQIKYISKQLLQQPLEPLYELVARHRGSALIEQKRERRLAGYRDALIEEALESQRRCRESATPWEEDWTSEVVGKIAADLPHLDQPAMTRLAFLFTKTRHPRYSREIFRNLRAAQELRDRALKKDRYDAG